MASNYGYGRHQPNLSDDRIARSVEALDAFMGKNGRTIKANRKQRRKIAGLAEQALKRLRDDRGMATLSLEEQFVVEAVVVQDGSRPVIDVGRDGLIIKKDSLGDWTDVVVPMVPIIRQVASSVGRIDAPHLGNSYAGTGFAVGDHLVMTNRHVLELLAIEMPGSALEDVAWRFRSDALIDFAVERGNDESKQFVIDDVAYAPPKKTLGVNDFTVQDFCVLRCKPNPDVTFPEALAIFSDPTKYDVDRDLYVLGFPSRPRRWFASGDPAAGSETIDVITSIFEDRFGHKRMSVGEIDESPGFNEKDERKTIFGHDASSLNGSSGSCVLDLSTYGDRVLGLHIGGKARVMNYAHSLAALREDLRSLGLSFA